MSVGKEERVSRFLFFKKWISPEIRRVVPDAFISDAYIELPESGTNGLDGSIVGELGEQTAKSRSDQPTLYGRADLKAETVLKQGLEIIRDDTSPSTTRTSKGGLRWKKCPED